MGMPSRSLAGCLDLVELAALLEAAPLLVANNTGPVHVAAAVGTPVVDIYALTNPQHTPWGVPSRVLFHDVPCRFCYKSRCPLGHHACLRQVSPDAVVEAVRDLHAETRAAANGHRSPASASLGAPIAETAPLPGAWRAFVPGAVEPAVRSDRVLPMLS
jgi:hypothetical protein